MTKKQIFHSLYILHCKLYIINEEIMNLEKTLKEYLDELSSNSPTPGGGNVSAMCGVLSASLGEMVCNLTIGKKKYAEVEQEMISTKEQFISLKQKFLELAEKDNEAFNNVMNAFKLPKESDDEKLHRGKKIEEATYGAAEVPAEVIQLCREMIPLIQTIAKKGNQNSISDTGVAALLISTATKGAFLNVLINCSSIKQNAEAKRLLETTEAIAFDIDALVKTITGEIDSCLKN